MVDVVANHMGNTDVNSGVNNLSMPATSTIDGTSPMLTSPAMIKAESKTTDLSA